MATVLTASSAQYIGRSVPRLWPTACPPARHGPLSDMPPGAARWRVLRVDRCSPLRRMVRLALWSRFGPRAAEKAPNRCHPESAAGPPRQRRQATPRPVCCGTNVAYRGGGRDRRDARRTGKAPGAPSYLRQLTLLRCSLHAPLRTLHTRDLFLLQRKQDVCGSPRLG